MLIKPNIYNLIIGALLSIAGIYVWLNPLDTLILIALYLGIIFILIGASFVIEYFVRKKTKYLGYGLLNLAIGIIFVSKSSFVAISISLILALWILFSSTEQVSTSIDLKKLNIDFWKYPLISGIIGIIFSLIILVHPSVGALTIAIIIGTYMIMYGILEILEYFLIPDINITDL